MPAFSAASASISSHQTPHLLSLLLLLDYIIFPGTGQEQDGTVLVHSGRALTARTVVCVMTGISSMACAMPPRCLPACIWRQTCGLPAFWPLLCPPLPFPVHWNRPLLSHTCLQLGARRSPAFANTKNRLREADCSSMHSLLPLGLGTLTHMAGREAGRFSCLYYLFLGEQFLA